MNISVITGQKTAKENEELEVRLLPKNHKYLAKCTNCDRKSIRLNGLEESSMTMREVKEPVMDGQVRVTIISFS